MLIGKSIWNFKRKVSASLGTVSDRFDREVRQPNLQFKEIRSAARGFKFDKWLTRLDPSPLTHQNGCDDSTFEMLYLFDLARRFCFACGDRNNIKLPKPRPNTKAEANPDA